MHNVGTPSAVFIPAANHKFKDVTEIVEISVPTKGLIETQAGGQEEYDISPQPGLILFGTLLSALFAHRKYPDIEGNQRFVISGVEVSDEETYVVGRVIEFLEGD